ncbi:MAG: Mur ligase family protein [Wenzhouxiangella sp.]
MAWFELNRPLLEAAIKRADELDRRLEQCGVRAIGQSATDREEPMEFFGRLVACLLKAAGHGAGTTTVERRSCLWAIALPVEESLSALRAGELAAELLSIDTNSEPDDLLDRAAAFLRFASARTLDADAKLVREAAHAAGLPTFWLDQEPFDPSPPDRPIRVGLLQLGHGCRRRLVAGAMPEGASEHLLESIRCRAELMPRLAQAGLPLPRQDLEFGNQNSARRAIRAAERLGYPVAVRTLYKPRFPHLSNTPDTLGPLHRSSEVAAAFDVLAGPHRRVWVESWPPGQHYRCLVIGGRLRAVSSAPYTEDVLDRISQPIRELAERAAAVCKLPVLAGVDMAVVDPAGPAEAANCVITNVLPDPDLMRHGDHARRRSIAACLVDTLFPDCQRARIPLVAVTGTNGKTTTCRMLARILAQAFDAVGLATTEGAFLGGERIIDGDVAGVTGAAMVLADNRTRAAVLETARGGLLKTGTAFDHCDVATCLNVRADHLGVDGIDSLEAMAEVKGRLIGRATRSIVLNADDPLCLNMRARARCRHLVLVAKSGQHPELLAHRRQGGKAVFVDRRSDGDWLILARGEQQSPLMALAEIPATMEGLLESNCFNARFAAATAWALGIDPARIRQALAGFSNSTADNPGRYNFITGYPFTVLSDFAQNPDGVERVLEVVDRLQVSGRVHLVCMTIGARHRCHIDELAGAFAQRFATIMLSGYTGYIERNPEWAGANPQQKMLDYFRQKVLAAGALPSQVTTFADRAQAIRTGLDQAVNGDLVLVLAPPEVALAVFEPQTALTRRSDRNDRQRPQSTTSHQP